MWKRYRTVFVADGGGHEAPEPEPIRTGHAMAFVTSAGGHRKGASGRWSGPSSMASARAPYWSIRSDAATSTPAAALSDRPHPCPCRGRDGSSAWSRRCRSGLINWGYAVSDLALRSHHDPRFCRRPRPSLSAIGPVIAARRSDMTHGAARRHRRPLPDPDAARRAAARALAAPARRRGPAGAPDPLFEVSPELADGAMAATKERCSRVLAEPDSDAGLNPRDARMGCPAARSAWPAPYPDFIEPDLRQRWNYAPPEERAGFLAPRARGAMVLAR